MRQRQFWGLGSDLADSFGVVFNLVVISSLVETKTLLQEIARKWTRLTFRVAAVRRPSSNYVFIATDHV